LSKAPYTIAALDLGSNSFHMVIARVEEGRPIIIDTIKESVRLREGLNKKGILSKEAMGRALECLERFEQRLRGIDREHIRVVGTNTLRGAKNSGRFLEQILELLGKPVEVIRGTEEARLIYLGVTTQLADRPTRNLVGDIGGGSTELILGHQHVPNILESRPMGCVSYTQEFFGEGKLSKRRFDDAIDKVQLLLEPYRRKLKRKHWDVAIGTSGTAKATAAILTQQGKTRNTITAGGLEDLLQQAIDCKRIDSLELPGLKPDRAPVYPGGLAILCGVFRSLGIEEMEISYQSLREGVILDLIGRETSDIRRETVAKMMTFYRVDVRQAETVRDTALKLFPQIAKSIRHETTMARNVLGWAADLHEIGLAIAHANYHRHGAYILLHGDMTGFSRIEQGLLSFLVLNHRKSLKKTELPYENKHDWALLLVLRLSVIFHRERRHKQIPEVTLTYRHKSIQLVLDADWLADHPLTRKDLEEEARYWKKLGPEFRFETRQDAPE